MIGIGDGDSWNRGYRMVYSCSVCDRIFGRFVEILGEFAGRILGGLVEILGMFVGRILGGLVEIGISRIRTSFALVLLPGSTLSFSSKNPIIFFLKVRLTMSN